MNKGQIYAAVALVSLFQLLLILNRTVRTKYKENIDSGFTKLLNFFAAFCCVDCLWGLCNSKMPFVSKGFFTVVTYGYHLLCGLSAFLWFGYMMYYMKKMKRAKIVFNLARYTLISIQIGMIIVNLFTGYGFYIDANLEYNTGVLRTPMFIAQFLYYIVIIMYTVYRLLSRKTIDKDLYKNVLLFSIVPLFFGIGQLLFYDVAMYSMGFMLSAFIIYAYNLTEIREKHLTNIAEESEKNAKIDIQTELFNRRAYEDDIAEYPDVPTEADYVYISMDLNSLKDINDKYGHDAGDEYIKAAAACMKQCFGSYGRLYRVGGDEFVAQIFANESQLEKIKKDFEETTALWSGKLIQEVYVSCGYAPKREMPQATVLQLAKMADERMYRAKEEFYSRKGFDRRRQVDSFFVMCSLYKTVLKINLTRDIYDVIIMDEAERSKNEGLSKSISSWLKCYAESGQVAEEDTALLYEKTDPEFLRTYFRNGENKLVIRYHMKNEDNYSDCIMEIVPGKEYSNENQVLFLYIKVLE